MVLELGPPPPPLRTTLVFGVQERYQLNAQFPIQLEIRSKLEFAIRFGTNRDTLNMAKVFVNKAVTALATDQAHWRKACIASKRWRVSDDELRRAMSEGEGACSPRFKVRSHLPLRGKLGWMTPRVGVKTTLTNGNASLGALVPKQGPHFFAHPFRKQNRTAISGGPN